MKRSLLKVGLACFAAATMLLGALAPAKVYAETNVQASVDKKVDTKFRIRPYRGEITINQGGKYELKAELSKDANKLGFMEIVGNNLKVSYVCGRVEYYPLVWKSSDPSRVVVSKKGVVTAKNVSKFVDGAYKPVAITASIDPSFKVTAAEDGRDYYFLSGLVYKNFVTVVPTSDLSVYFQGVWAEKYKDTDAHHDLDFPVRESNEALELTVMCEVISDHKPSSNYKVMAYTKTNDSVVRAYIFTTDKKAGRHYYVASFYTDEEGKNVITVAQRDYCETEYEYAGSFTRAEFK